MDRMRTPEAKGRNLIDSNKMQGAKGRGTGHAEESNGHLQGGRPRAAARGGAKEGIARRRLRWAESTRVRADVRVW